MTKEEIVELFLKLVETNPMMPEVCAGLVTQFDADEFTREELLKAADGFHADADEIRASVDPVIDEVLRVGREVLTAQSLLDQAAEAIDAQPATYVPPDAQWGEEHWTSVISLFKAIEGLGEFHDAESLKEVESNILGNALAFLDAGGIDILKNNPLFENRWGISFNVGDFVKVLFVVDPPVDGCSGERMWVKVTEINTPNIKGFYAMGILNNDPVVRTDLKDGDEVRFYLADVLEVDRV